MKADNGIDWMAANWKFPRFSLSNCRGAYDLAKHWSMNMKCKGKITMQPYSSTQTSGAQFKNCFSAGSHWEISQIHQAYYLHNGHKKQHRIASKLSIYSLDLRIFLLVLNVVFFPHDHIGYTYTDRKMHQEGITLQHNISRSIQLATNTAFQTVP